MRYLALLFLISCSASYNEERDYKMPPELEGCRVFKLEDGGPSPTTLYVIKCPNDQPSVSWGENCGKSCSHRNHVQVVHK
jgi:hypothetical protein